MPRPHRDVREIAIEAALYHKQRVPTEEVPVRDLRDGTVVTIGWTDGKGVRAGVVTAEPSGFSTSYVPMTSSHFDGQRLHVLG